MVRSSDPPMTAIPLSVLILIQRGRGESLARLVRNHHIGLTRRREETLVKSVRERGQENAHAKNHHHADDDGEGGEKGPQLAPTQVAGGESQLEIHSFILPKGSPFFGATFFWFDDLPDIRHEAIPHLLRVFGVPRQIFLQELLLVEDSNDQHGHDENKKRESPP